MSVVKWYVWLWLAFAALNIASTGADIAQGEPWFHDLTRSCLDLYIASLLYDLDAEKAKYAALLKSLGYRTGGLR